MPNVAALAELGSQIELAKYLMGCHVKHIKIAADSAMHDFDQQKLGELSATIDNLSRLYDNFLYSRNN